MSDPAIKLFGKTIPLPDLAVSPQELNKVPVLLPDPCIGNDDDGIEGDDDGRKETKEGKANECEEEQEEESLRHECNNVAASTTSGITEKTETTKAGGAAKTDEESSQNDTSACSQEAKLKKPDKILPCPRCNSMETKFCYYNNYNVNQPRHFCKKCQRYWTAGGTMRNVPVGAGRRKNKNPASHFNRHVSLASAEAMHKARSDVHHPNGPSLLTFGSDAVLCESMASGLNLAEKTLRGNESEALKITIPCDNNQNTNTNTNTNTSTCSNPLKEEVGATTTMSTMPKVPCFPGPPAWPYAWNGVSWTVLPFYPPPPAYWSCPPGAWNSFTWLPQPNSPSGSGPNSPTLGKHSREENLGKSGTTFEEIEPPGERSLWVPKTLRIDDPEEAAKSSIWETLGINKDIKEDTFRAFRSNKEKCNVGEAKTPQRRPDLQANPAAFSRSANFHESS